MKVANVRRRWTQLTYGQLISAYQHCSLSSIRQQGFLEEGVLTSVRRLFARQPGVLSA
ncbi:MAG: hypothetical protein ABSD75_15995 [Terriglobales bacterium]|jgi:hypothetical protein